MPHPATPTARILAESRGNVTARGPVSKGDQRLGGRRLLNRLGCDAVLTERGEHRLCQLLLLLFGEHAPCVGHFGHHLAITVRGGFLGECLALCGVAQIVLDGFHGTFLCRTWLRLQARETSRRASETRAFPGRLAPIGTL